MWVSKDKFKKFSSSPYPSKYLQIESGLGTIPHQYNAFAAKERKKVKILKPWKKAIFSTKKKK